MKRALLYVGVMTDEHAVLYEAWLTTLKFYDPKG
jgi:hypothetical protein